MPGVGASGFPPPFWSYANGQAAIKLPLSQLWTGSIGSRADAVAIDNGTAKQLYIKDGSDGLVASLNNAYIIIPPYQSRIFTTPSWRGLSVAGNAVAFASTDTLVIFAYSMPQMSGGAPDHAHPGLPIQFSSYGPASWGGGFVPNALSNVNAGDQFLAWQIQQLINLLTGVMTGQEVTLTEGTFPQITLSNPNNVTGARSGLVLKTAGWNVQLATNQDNHWLELDDANGGVQHHWDAKDYTALGSITATNQLTCGSAGATVSEVVNADSTGNPRIQLVDGSGSKFLRVFGNALQVINNAFNVVLAALDDSGNFSITGTMTGASITDGTITGSKLSNSTITAAKMAGFSQAIRQLSSASYSTSSTTLVDIDSVNLSVTPGNIGVNPLMMFAGAVDTVSSTPTGVDLMGYHVVGVGLAEVTRFVSGDVETNASWSALELTRPNAINAAWAQTGGFTLQKKSQFFFWGVVPLTLPGS